MMFGRFSVTAARRLAVANRMPKARINCMRSYNIETIMMFHNASLVPKGDRRLFMEQ
jgi:hypothetical protein